MPPALKDAALAAIDCSIVTEAADKEGWASMGPSGANWGNVTNLQQAQYYIIKLWHCPNAYKFTMIRDICNKHMYMKSVLIGEIAECLRLVRLHLSLRQNPTH